MSSTAIPASATWNLPNRGKVGMACLIIAESAIFTIFVVAYLFYVGKSLSGPTPRQVLEVPIFYTICLLSSSITVHFATKLFASGNQSGFRALWFGTILLGGLFLFGTAREWHKLIYEHGLTISTNLFGTTYYSLVGLHGLHVCVGLLMLTAVFLFSLGGYVGRQHSERLEVLSMYWHFVDAIWVVVFTVVYIVGR
ncbi:MAG TPA: cytochrome c oxidase subunit 3 [Dongiaceae bacterium]|nr:cytochrome c oxidase subunit 3 [Dongiaceae bacterium]